jgi:hypothetical protein
MSPTHTGGILLKCKGPLRAPEQLAGALKEFAGKFIPLAAGVSAYAAVEGDESYLYFFTLEFGALHGPRLARIEENARVLAALKDLKVEIVRLAPMFDVPGASAGAAPPFHYVVETDVVPEHEADLNAWYDQEHMPGLAACPGTVRARRFRDPEGSPRYHSCYDLVRTETLGSEPWLAVRHTAWSDRVRPHFRNTKRTMFRRLFALEL